jgi:hypothetical protein
MLARCRDRQGFGTGLVCALHDFVWLRSYIYPPDGRIDGGPNTAKTKGSGMDIRPYREADEAAVIALWREVFPDTAPHNEQPQALRQKWAFERDLLFVAAVEGIVVGTVMAAMTVTADGLTPWRSGRNTAGPGSVRHWSAAWSGRWPSAAA